MSKVSGRNSKKLPPKLKIGHFPRLSLYTVPLLPLNNPPAKFFIKTTGAPSFNVKVLGTELERRSFVFPEINGKQKYLKNNFLKVNKTC